MATHTRVVRLISFPYRKELHIPHPDNPDRLVQKMVTAYRGETIEVNDFDLYRGNKLGAFYTEEELRAESEPQQEEVKREDVESLIDWILTDKPTVSEVVSSAQGDPAEARKLLAAEQFALEGNPRKGVVSGLKAIIDMSASSPSDEEDGE